MRQASHAAHEGNSNQELREIRARSRELEEPAAPMGCLAEYLCKHSTELTPAA